MIPYEGFYPKAYGEFNGENVFDLDTQYKSSLNTKPDRTNIVDDDDIDRIKIYAELGVDEFISRIGR